MRSLAEIIQLRTGPCRDAASLLPALAAGEHPERPMQDEPTLSHVGSCLRCQAELSAYRRLLAQLHELRDELETPPEGALAALLRAMAAEPTPGTHWAVRVAYVGGITVVTAAAGAAGVLVWMSRRRPGLARAS